MKGPQRAPNFAGAVRQGVFGASIKSKKRLHFGLNVVPDLLPKMERLALFGRQIHQLVKQILGFAVHRNIPNG